MSCSGLLTVRRAAFVDSIKAERHVEHIVEIGHVLGANLVRIVGSEVLAQSQVRVVGLDFVNRPHKVEDGRQELTQRHRQIEVAVERPTLLVVALDIVLDVRKDERHGETGEQADLADQHQVALQRARAQVDDVEEKDERSGENERVQNVEDCGREELADEWSSQ